MDFPRFANAEDAADARYLSPRTSFAAKVERYTFTFSLTR